MMRTRFARAHIPVATAAIFALAACTPQEAEETPATDDAAVSQESGDMQAGPDEQGPTAAEERATTPETRAVPAGTQLTFIVDETLSTDDTEAGQTFEAHLASAVTYADGTTAIDAGANARGIVVESHESEGAEDQAALVVRLATVELNGTMVPLEATVVSADTETGTRDSGAETAGKIAVGAAAGAIIGQILGRDTESTLAGAGAGAVAGTVVALTTRDGDATLPEGSTIVVRLDQPLGSN